MQKEIFNSQNNNLNNYIENEKTELKENTSFKNKEIILFIIFLIIIICYMLWLIKKSNSEINPKIEDEETNSLNINKEKKDNMNINDIENIVKGIQNTICNKGFNLIKKDDKITEYIQENCHYLDDKIKEQIKNKVWKDITKEIKDKVNKVKNIKYLIKEYEKKLMKLIQNNNSFDNMDEHKLREEIDIIITNKYISLKDSKNQNSIYLYLNNIERSSLFNAYINKCFWSFVPCKGGNYDSYKLHLDVMVFYMSSIFDNKENMIEDYNDSYSKLEIQTFLENEKKKKYSIGDMFIKLVCYIEVWKEIEINDESFNDDKYEEFKNKVINLKILENKLEELNQNNKNLFFDNKI